MSKQCSRLFNLCWWTAIRKILPCHTVVNDCYCYYCGHFINQEVTFQLSALIIVFIILFIYFSCARLQVTQPQPYCSTMALELDDCQNWIMASLVKCLLSIHGHCSLKISTMTALVQRRTFMSAPHHNQAIHRMHGECVTNVVIPVCWGDIVTRTSHCHCPKARRWEISNGSQCGVKIMRWVWAVAVQR